MRYDVKLLPMKANSATVASPAKFDAAEGRRSGIGVKRGMEGVQICSIILFL